MTPTREQAMDDRTLLERAAKAAAAAGMSVIQSEAGPQILQRKTADAEFYRQWAPLADDGDALRLAVKLHMSILSNETASWVATGMHQIVRAEEHHDGTDPYAATRRAIVRAAAEIGGE